MSISEARLKQLENLFATIDSMDVDGFVKFLTPDASFRFGSAPAAQGAEAIRAAVGGFFGTIKGLSHEVSRSMAEDGILVCEGSVTYTRADDSEITLPFVDVFEMSGDDLISDYRIYMDIGPLYAA